MQQYILSRLEWEESLRQHMCRGTAETLNQLHIKSNGCFLYLERVLDGVAEGCIVLREVRDIPGTLNGLYLWLCQRLLSNKHFSKVRIILNFIGVICFLNAGDLGLNVHSSNLIKTLILLNDIPYVKLLMAGVLLTRCV